jgi:hypothetical protein
MGREVNFKLGHYKAAASFELRDQGSRIDGSIRLRPDIHQFNRAVAVSRL